MGFLKNEKGITLLEVLLSITILSIIFISFMSFFPQMGFMNKQNEDKTQAVNIAKQILNKWRLDEDVEKALEIGTPWPVEPVIETPPKEYHLFIINDPKAEIKIWKTSEKGFTEDDSVKAYKIQVQVNNDRNLVLSETFGYVIVR
jgi:type II secretory pathway pseudopilin PulG